MIKGFIEAATLTRVSGWAIETSDLTARITLALIVNGEVRQKTVADIFRPDLLEVGTGDGCYGYQFDTPLTVDEMHQVNVIVADDPAKTELPRLGQRQPLKSKWPPVEPDQWPVFVLGAARSGTSAVGNALRTQTRYIGHNEGHILNLAGKLIGELSRFYKDSTNALSNATTIATVPSEYFSDGIFYLFRKFTYDRFQSQYWLDKTPTNEMIVLAPLFLKIWPNARFIFLKRRGIDNVASRLRKFEGGTFNAQCNSWAEAMRSWITVGPQLAGRALEIDQFLVYNEPEHVAAEIGAFLRLAPDTVPRLANALADRSKEKTGPDERPALSLTEQGWDAGKIDAFGRICGPMMAHFGYSMGNTYFIPGVIENKIKRY